MSANTWLIIAVVGFSLSAVSLAAAVILFFRLKIPAVIGYLTGKTVLREVKLMRENSNGGTGKNSRQNTDSGTKSATAKAEVEKNGRVRGAAHSSKRLDKTSESLNESKKAKAKSANYTDNTSTTSTNSSQKITDVFKNSFTAGLRSEATDVLKETVTEVLPTGTEVLSKETDVLTRATDVLSNGTDVLSENTTVLSTEKQPTEETVRPVGFKTVRSIIVVHSDEVIE